MSQTWTYHVHPCTIRECNDENCQKCAEEAGGDDFRWMHFAWLRVYLGSRRAGTWSIEDHWHEPVRFPGFRSSEMGSMQLLWFCQEEEMDVLDPAMKFEDLMALKEGEERELAAIELLLLTPWIARNELDRTRTTAFLSLF